jgi:hypothetical protein
VGRTKNCYSIKGIYYLLCSWIRDTTIVFLLQRKLRTLQKPLEPRASDDELRMDLTLRQDEDSGNVSVVPSAPPAVTTPSAAPSEVAPTAVEAVSSEVSQQSGE